ncbi:MAG: hypothetical protein GEU90_21735 [Gemmatimonas sp.]|nr:hypothetical protein [Gemmatimonas sp.]
MAQTGSADICEVAQSFAEADRATDRVATASHEQQHAAQQAWREALGALAEQLPAGAARSAAETLRGAQTVVSDEPWTEEQETAHSVLAQDLKQRCDIEL